MNIFKNVWDRCQQQLKFKWMLKSVFQSMKTTDLCCIAFVMIF